MHTSIRSARPAAVLALTVAAALVAPGIASASTTTPTTSTTSPTGTATTGSPAGTTAPSTTAAPTTGGATTTTGPATTGSTAPASTTAPTSGPTTGSPSGSTTTATAPGTTTSAPSATSTAPSASATTLPTSAAAKAAPAGLVPGGNSARYGLAAAAALPATSTDPALVAAGYLTRELAAGQHHFSTVVPGFGTFADYGVTADAVLALAAAGAGQDEATAATTYLSQHVVDYVGFGDPNEIAAGAVAKLLNVAVVQGVDPTAFGGHDLVASLEAREAPSGRFSDQSAFGDNSNTFGQSLALIGLHRAGVTTSANARTYLLSQQCSNGGFLLFMSDAGCTDPASADPDATAMAVQALIAIGGSTAQANAGLDYLVTHQVASGGVGGGGPQTAPNANTTGLAGQAFLAGGRSANARRASSFITALQYGCTFPASLRGGIAYDRTAYTTQGAAGAAAAPADQDRRSTSQALLALAGTPLFAVSATGADATAPQLTCAAATTTTPPTTTRPTNTTTTTSATSTRSTGAGGSGAGGGTGANDPASATPTSLAFTGADIGLTVLVALLLLAAGAAALVVARRKGAHA